MPPDVQSEEWETARTLIDVPDQFPPGVPILSTAVEFILFLYDFGKQNPIEAALQRIYDEIKSINTRLTRLEERTNVLAHEVARTQNRTRAWQLKQLSLDLGDESAALRNRPDDRVRAAEAADAAQRRADEFLDDEALWEWTDLRRTYRLDEHGNRVGAPEVMPFTGFKHTIALPVYSLALATWVAAMLIECRGDRPKLKDKYGTALARHLDAVTVRYSWHDNFAPDNPPVTIPEKIRSRIICSPLANHKYAENGSCDYTLECTNLIDRTRTTLGQISVVMDSRGPFPVLCTINPEIFRIDEQAVEDAEPGIVTLNTWAEILGWLAREGILPPAEFQGVFVSETPALAEVYGVDGNGTIDYFRQQHPGSNGTWQTTSRVGHLWTARKVVPGGANVAYAVEPDGSWWWLRHVGAERVPPTDAWKTPVNKGKPTDDDRWLTNRTVFGTGDGVIYGIVKSPEQNHMGLSDAGDLQWMWHEDYANGGGRFWGPAKVGSGWLDVRFVFGMGDGVMYTVAGDGTVWWHKHLGRFTGDANWAQRAAVAEGWTGYRHVFGATNGYIYAMRPNGSMVCYHHIEWRTGGRAWEGPFAVGGNWLKYRHLFASLPGNLGGVF
ncbi:tachylectin-related carbohydrate-binding protein [Actinomycetes bacterium KLBMP 9797]